MRKTRIRRGIVLLSLTLTAILGTIALRSGRATLAQATLQETIVIKAGIEETGNRIELAPAPVDRQEGALTAEDALAAFEKGNTEFERAPDVIAELGLYTSAIGNEIYRFRDHLAWGFRWHACPPPPPTPPEASAPADSGESPCILWLILDARTGEMLEGVFQQ